jgi:hypothetical protein
MPGRSLRQVRHRRLDLDVARRLIDDRVDGGDAAGERRARQLVGRDPHRAADAPARVLLRHPKFT